MLPFLLPPAFECRILTTALGVAILGGIKLANERRAVEGNIMNEVIGVCRISYAMTMTRVSVQGSERGLSEVTEFRLDP
jgi:hypothetical protein